MKMIRKGFKMFVYPDKIEEYIKRHNPIWAELQETLKQHGVSNYSIFLDKETNALFGYAEVATEAQWKAISNTDICKKWWNYMADLMETSKDNSPVTLDLESVFYMP